MPNDVVESSHALARSLSRRRAGQASRPHHALRAALLALAVLTWLAVTPRAHGATYVVTSTADDTGATDCLIQPSNCSLRQAIRAANATIGVPDVIAFDIPGPGPHVIELESTLPGFTDPVTIDGTTEPDWQPASDGPGAPVVAIDGNGVASWGLNFSPGNTTQVGAHGSIVRGLAIYGAAAALHFDRVDGCTVEGNFLGLDATGTLGLGGGFGVRVVGGDATTIGGATPDARNVISGNDSHGVHIVGQGADDAVGNVVRGNYIGTGPGGATVVTNADGLVSNDIGVSAFGPLTTIEDNVISGNALGVQAAHAQILVRGNLIGTDASGTMALANARHGLQITTSAAVAVTVGGPGPGEGNVIAGNGQHGVLIDHVAVTGTSIRGNFIGTDPTASVDVGNGLDGVRIMNGASQNQIGGTGAGEGNVIAFNGGGGVVVLTDLADGNRISGNRIFDNGGLGIDLSRFSNQVGNVTANDAGDGDDGPNGEQNFPVLIGVTASLSGGVIVEGSLTTAPGTYDVEVFASAAADPSGHGEGAVFIGAFPVAVDTTGATSFSEELWGVSVLAGDVITATATSADGDTSELSGAVVAEPPAPGLSIDDVALVEGNSGDTAFVFTITLDAPSPSPCTVTVATAPGTATSTFDFDDISAAVELAAMQTEATVTVNVHGDVVNEGHENFFVDLSNPTGGVVLSDPRGEGLILNDDTELHVSDTAAPEGDVAATPFVFELTLSHPVAQSVIVDWATADGTATLANNDYLQVTDGQATFAPGETLAQITVDVVGDYASETNEAFLVNVIAAPGATIADGVGLGRIDDDDATVAIADVTAPETDGGAQFDFDLTLSRPKDVVVTVDWATSGATATAGVDFTSSSGTATFPIGETTASVSVEVLGDPLFENDESFLVTLSNPVHASIGDATGLGVIANDDVEITIASGSVVEGDGASSQLELVVSLSAPNPKPVAISVDYATEQLTTTNAATEGVDYQATSGTLVFAPGEQTHTVVVPVLGDYMREVDEVLWVRLTNPVNASLDTSLALGTIADDDTLIQISGVSVVEGDAGTTNAVLTVTALDTTKPVDITFEVTIEALGTLPQHAQPGQDYVDFAGPRLVTLPANQTSTTFTVEIVADSVAELDELLLLRFANPVHASLANTTALVTIVNDDEALPAVSIGDASADEGAGVLLVPITLSAPAAQPVTVEVSTQSGTASAGSDFVEVTGLVVPFEVGEQTRSVAIDLVDDATIEAAETFLLRVTDALGATIADGEGEATIEDDEEIALEQRAVAFASESDPDGARRVPFVLGLTRPTAIDIEVRITTVDVTAEAGLDYVSLDQDVLFTPSLREQTVFVDVLDDPIHEGDETLGLHAERGGVAVPLAAEGTILDDEEAPTVSVTGSTRDESEGSLDFFITLSHPSSLPVDVDYTTVAGGTATAGSDYTETSGTVTLPPLAVDVAFAVPIAADGVYEGDETVVVWSSALGATLDPTADEATGTIVSSDPLEVSVSTDVAVTEGDEGDERPLVIELTVASQPAEIDVPFHVETIAGSASASADFVPLDEEVVLPAGSSSLPVTVTVVGDGHYEGDETLFVLVTPLAPLVVTPAEPATGTIVDDEPFPYLEIEDVSAEEQDADRADFIFVASISPPSALDVTFRAMTADGTATSADGDYEALDLIFAIPAGQTSVGVPVSVYGDIALETDEVFELRVLDVTNATPPDGPAIGTILNDDVANEPPVGRPDGYVVPNPSSAPRPLVVDATEGVLGNDADSEGGVLAAVLVTAPALGTLTLAADGGFTYLPPAAFHGDVVFEYVADDGERASDPIPVRFAVVEPRSLAGDGDFDREPFEVAVAAVDDAAHVSERGFAGCTPGDGSAAWTTQARTDLPPAAPEPGVYLPGHIDGDVFDGAFAITGTARDGCEELVAYYEIVDAPAQTLRVTLQLGAWYAGGSATDPGQVGVAATLRADTGGGFGPPVDLGHAATGLTLVAPSGGGATDGTSPAYRVDFDSGLVDGAWPAGSLLELRLDASGFEGHEDWIFGANEVTAESVLDNLPPEASDDGFRVNQGGELVANVLLNDLDPDDDALTALLHTAPTHAEVFELAPDGTFYYRHDCSESGTDTFSYLASDGDLMSRVTEVRLDIASIDALLIGLRREVLELPLRLYVRAPLAAHVAVARLAWAWSGDQNDALAVAALSGFIWLIEALAGWISDEDAASLIAQAEELIALMTHCGDVP